VSLSSQPVSPAGAPAGSSSPSSFPLVLCTGMLRSGSTWSFNVCRLMAKVIAGREGRPMAATYLTREPCEKFLATQLGRCPGPTVLKVHEPGPLALNALRTGAARGVSTYRDPRDCVASMMTFTGRSFDQAARSISAALDLLEASAAAGNTLFIRYEDMLRDRAAHVAQIAAFLGLSLDAKILSRIDQLTSLPATQRICEDLKQRPADKLLRSTDDHRVDPETWLHDNHIQSGRPGRWRDELTPAQASALQQEFGTRLSRMGYDANSERA